MASPLPSSPPVTQAFSEPVVVEVPAIEVRSALLDLGQAADGTIEVPHDFDLAGWYTLGSKPGQAGPLVIAGHVDSVAGPAVFFRLRELAPGDIVEVETADGTVVSYRVDRVEQHPKDAFPTFAVYGHTDEPTLRLVTCGGEFDSSVRSYRDNIVVFASLT